MPGQVAVPAESRADASAHDFWNQEFTAMFYIYICQPRYGLLPVHDTRKYLSKAEKNKKDLYLQACLERRRSFTPKVSALVIPSAEYTIVVKERLRSRQA